MYCTQKKTVFHDHFRSLHGSCYYRNCLSRKILCNLPRPTQDPPSNTYRIAGFFRGNFFLQIASMYGQMEILVGKFLRCR